MKRTEETVLMNMCMVTAGGKVAVIDRKKPDWPGITFPGGHMENGESVVDSVVREIKEETGLEIVAPTLCGITDWCDEGRRYIVFLFKAETFTGELVSSDEGEVWWESIENLKNLKLTSGMELYLKVFADTGISELFYKKVEDDWESELK
ncbi:MAG: 8-oxo-dGTP diphosphatase [Clostridia bacterium]|nr:8-oxo-dGTP diphosphatase [Clostridia bacterium]